MKDSKMMMNYSGSVCYSTTGSRPKNVMSQSINQHSPSYSLRLSVKLLYHCLYWLIVGLVLIGCASGDIKPVELYPEDQCAQCRMAISNEAFASEIITRAGEVFKFDDLGCQEKFLNEKSGLAIAAAYVKDYQTRAWIPREKSFIVATSIKTPMGSGKIAVADSTQARQFAEKYPAKDLTASEGCACCTTKAKN